MGVHTRIAERPQIVSTPPRPLKRRENLRNRLQQHVGVSYFYLPMQLDTLYISIYYSLRLMALQVSRILSPRAGLATTPGWSIAVNHRKNLTPYFFLGRS